MLVSLYDHEHIIQAVQAVQSNSKGTSLHFHAKDHRIHIVTEFKTHPLPGQVLKACQKQLNNC